MLVLSQYVEPAYAVGLLEDGAEGVGYLLKDRISDLEEFASAVRRVGEGGSALDPAVVSQLLGRRRADDPLDALTPREREVLELMAEGRSNQAIAERMFVTLRAVEKHVTSIFTKLDLPASSDDHRRVLAVLAFLRDLRCDGDRPMQTRLRRVWTAMRAAGSPATIPHAAIPPRMPGGHGLQRCRSPSEKPPLAPRIPEAGPAGGHLQGFRGCQDPRSWITESAQAAGSCARSQDPARADPRSCRNAPAGHLQGSPAGCRIPTRGSCILAKKKVRFPPPQDA